MEHKGEATRLLLALRQSSDDVKVKMARAIRDWLEAQETGTVITFNKKNARFEEYFCAVKNGDNWLIAGMVQQLVADEFAAWMAAGNWVTLVTRMKGAEVHYMLALAGLAQDF